MYRIVDMAYYVQTVPDDDGRRLLLSVECSVHTTMSSNANHIASWYNVTRLCNEVFSRFTATCNHLTRASFKRLTLL